MTNLRVWRTEWRLMLTIPLAGLLLFGLACQTVGGSGGGGPQGEDQPAGAPAEREAGRLIYQESCTGCHGTPGAADGHAPDLNNASANELQATLDSGRHPGGAHAPLGDDELVQLSTYLAAGGAAPDPPDTPSGPDVPLDPDPPPAGHPCDPCLTAADRATVAPTLEQKRAEGVSQADAVIQLRQAMIEVGVDPGVCPGCAEAMVAEAYEGAAPDPTPEPTPGPPTGGDLDHSLLGAWRYEWYFYDATTGFESSSYTIMQFNPDGTYYQVDETCAAGGARCSEFLESYGHWTTSSGWLYVNLNDGGSFNGTYIIEESFGELNLFTQAEGRGDQRMWTYQG